MFLTWFRQPRNCLIVVAGCRPSNGNKVCLVLSCPHFAEWQREGTVILCSAQAWICWEWEKWGWQSIFSLWIHTAWCETHAHPLHETVVNVQPMRLVGLGGNFHSFQLQYLVFESWVVDSFFIYHERKKNEGETPSSGQWIRRQGTQFFLDRSERKKHLKSYSSWTKNWPSQPAHALSLDSCCGFSPQVKAVWVAKKNGLASIGRYESNH